MFDIVNCVLRPIFGQREGGNDVDLLVVEKWSRGLGVAIVFLVSRHETSPASSALPVIGIVWWGLVWEVHCCFRLSSG